MCLGGSGSQKVGVVDFRGVFFGILDPAFLPDDDA